VFLNPILLYGAALAGVPILIHLLSKRRYRIVPWAAMDFLLQAIQQNQRRLQLRDLLLMLIRAAAVLALALALARPALTGRAALLGGRSSTAAVLLMDTSCSMGYHNGRETRLEAAQRLAKTLLTRFEKNSWCAVLTFSHDVKAPLGDPSQNLGFVEQELERAVTLTDGETNLERALRAALQLFRSRPDFRASRKELYILTDFQAHPWQARHVSAAFPQLLRDLSREAAVVLVDVGETGGANTAVTELTASDTLVSTGMPVAFTARIRNLGPLPLDGLPVDFYVDPAPGAEGPLDRATVSIQPGESATVKFETRFRAGGDHKVAVQVAPDRLPADNRRFATIEVIAETHVLLVDGRERRADDPLSSETGYLQRALAPRDPENPDKQSVIAVETVPAHRLAEKNLAEYQAVALCNVERLPAATVHTLARQVRAGLGLMIFLGDRTEPAFYNEKLGENGAKLLPAAIQEPWGQAPRWDDPKPPAFSTFARDPAALAHPILAAFNEEDAADLLSHVKLYRAYGLAPLAGEGVQVVARGEDGRPLIVERRVGSGRVLLCAFPATTAWSNLPTQFAFPILIPRAAARLTLGYRPPKNVLVGDPLRGVVGVGEQHLPVRVTPPAPLARRQTTAERSGEGPAVFEFPETDRAGFYEVSVEAAPGKTSVYSVNVHAEAESDLTRVEPEQLRAEYPLFEFSYVSKSEDLAARMTAERQGVEVWPWLLAAVFVLLLAESVLALRWAPRH
jgi:hypothetical protein